MGRITWILTALLLSSEVSAREGDGENLEHTAHLQSRMRALKSERGALIQSFQNKDQSYIYDQALAIIAFASDGKKSDAKRLLKGLASLQLPDGSLYFSYYLDGTSPYPGEGDRRIAGSIAWVALAATHYQSRFNEREFVPFTRKILTYLAGQIREAEISGSRQKAVVFSPVDLPGSAFDEADVLALEHNLDALSAFTNFTKLNPQENWSQEILSLRKFVLSMWDPDRRHFWSGASLGSGRVNRSEFYLDNQTWSLLALDHDTLASLAPMSALAKSCESLLTSREGIIGFSDRKPSKGPARHEFVWSEGTLGYALALQKLTKITKENVRCQNLSADAFIQYVRNMKTSDGGVAYATGTENPDFTTASSVAGTAWLIFAEKAFNPFEVN